MEVGAIFRWAARRAEGVDPPSTPRLAPVRPTSLVDGFGLPPPRRTDSGMARVDYERSAGAYRTARTLPPPILEEWRRAIENVALPPGGLVLDIGAGTGQFVAPLTDWLGARVFAVEPQSAMRAEAREPGVGTPYVAAEAEDLPLARAAVDIAWLSTVMHQFAGLVAAIAELRRVVRPGGAVLIRGLFSDMTATGILASFPGIDRSVATFPDTATIAQQFAAAGFGDHEILDVPERWAFELDAWVTRARSIRSTDSIFRPLTDAEFEDGLASIVERYGDQPGPIVSETVLRLLVVRA